MTIALLALAVLLGIGDVVQFFVRRERMALRARFGGAPLTPAAGLPIDGLARVVGRATAPSTESELTGESVLLERVTILRRTAEGRLVRVEEVLLGGDFELTDETGKVTVVLGATELRVPTTRAFERGGPQVAGDGPNHEPTDAVVAWVAARGHTIPTGDLRVVVRAVRVNDPLMVVGAPRDGRLHTPPDRPLLAATPDALGSKWDRPIIAVLGSLTVTLVLLAGWSVT